MSGGRGGEREGRGVRSRNSYGVDVSSGVGTSGVKSAPGPTNPGGGRTASNGESRMQAAGTEPKRTPKPTSPGPTGGIDTGGAGTDPGLDPAQMIRSTAARLKRSRMARGGGLSNVRFGEATLG